MPVPDRIAVVGAGLAGSYAVAGLRRRGFTGHLTLLGAETSRPYDRPPLSKGVLSGGQTSRLEGDLGIVLEDACDVVRLGTRVDRVTVDDAGVQLDGRDVGVAADAVLLASGAAPVVPAGWDGVLGLRTLDDAFLLRSRLSPGVRLVVVGAGWIGAEVAGAAAAAGCHVTVVEALAAPLAREVGPHVGAATSRWHAAAGVRLLTGRRVVAARGDGVLLEDGERVPADAVLAAIGVRPELPHVLGSEPGGARPGVRVGADLRLAGAAGRRALAAGDCALRWSGRYRRWMPSGHWEAAMLAGDAAAGCLVGEAVEHDPPPYVFSTQFGRQVALAGHPDPASRLVWRGDPHSGDRWSVAWLRPSDRGDRLVALVAVDRPRDVAQARRALSAVPGDGVTVDATALADPGVAVRAALRP